MSGVVLHPEALDLEQSPAPGSVRRYGPCRLVVSLAGAPGTQHAEPEDLVVLIPPIGPHEPVQGYNVADALCKAKCRVYTLFPDFTPAGTRLEAL